MPPKARQVQEALNRLGVPSRVVELPASTRTSAEAAAAVGTTLARIAKSLVFLTADNQPVLVIASGANRVDVAKLAREVGKAVRLADAVKRLTGFSIGGVSPSATRFSPSPSSTGTCCSSRPSGGPPAPPMPSFPSPPPTWSGSPAAG